MWTNVSVERIKIIKHHGESIILMDFSNLALDEFIDHLNKCLDFIKKQHSTELLFLFDVSNAKIFGDVLMECKKFAMEIKKYRRKSALIGVTVGKMHMLNSILRFTGARSSVKVFNSTDEATDWLASK